MKYLFSCFVLLTAPFYYAMAFSSLAREDVLLTNFLEAAPVIELEDSYLICDNQPLVLDAGNQGPGAAYTWEHLSTNKVVSTERYFEVTNAGNYKLTVTVGSESATKSFVVAESFTPDVQIAKSHTLCVGTVVTLDVGNPGAKFLWINENSGDTISEAQTATIAFKGKYTVAAITPCGTSVSAFIVDETEYPDLGEVPATGYLCAGESVTIDAKNFDARAVWIDTETGDTLATTKRITLEKLGDYEVILYNQCDTVSKIVSIVPRESPEIGLADEMFICGDEAIELDAGISGAAYEWVNIDTKAVVSNARSIMVDKNGRYSIKVIDACGVAFDTVKVSKTKSPDFTLKNQYLICDGVAEAIGLNLFDVNFEWTQDGEILSTESEFTPPAAGAYSVSVSNGCGSSTQNFSVTESFTPEITIPTEVNMMALEGAVVLDAENEGASYRWIDVALGTVIGETQTMAITRSGQYILGVTTACGSVEKAIVVNLITGINKESQEAVFSVAPNPASTSLTIRKNQKVQEELSINLYDITGKTIVRFADPQGFKTDDTYTIDVSGFPRGVYILNITGEETYRTKLLLQ